jgi:hypothetical protein
MIADQTPIEKAMNDLPTTPSPVRTLLLAAASASAVLLPLALYWLSATGSGLRLHLVIAVSLAIVLSLLLAAGLMGLVFHSAASGHDQRVADEQSAFEPDSWRDD